MTSAVLDDHLLRDFLADDMSAGLGRVLERHEPATTNMYLYRLSRSVVSAPGGALTGAWKADQRRELGRRLLMLPDSIKIVPLRLLAYRMAEIASTYRVSTLGAEAVAAAEHLRGRLCVWEGDDGPGVRAAMTALDAPCETVAR